MNGDFKNYRLSRIRAVLAIPNQRNSENLLHSAAGISTEQAQEMQKTEKRAPCNPD